MKSYLKSIDVSGKHYISLWNHENLLPVNEKRKYFFQLMLLVGKPLFPVQEKRVQLNV